MRLYSAIKPLQSGHNLHASRAGPERREEEKAEVQRAGKDFMEGKRSQQDSPTTPTGAPSPLDTLRHQTGQTRSPRACSVPPTRDLCRDISGASSLNEYARTHTLTRARTHAKSQTRLSDFTFTFHFHALEKEMATHSSVLAWRIPGTGEPGGLPSMGSHRVGHY